MSEETTIEAIGEGVIVRDNKSGRFVAGTRTPKPITVENSHIYQRKRQEKTARLLRERIQSTHNGVMPSQVKSSPEAFAEAGAMLYENIVLNTEAYPRDRMEAWEKLGKYSQVLPSDLKQSVDAMSQAANAVSAVTNAETAQILARLLADVQRKQGE